MKRKLPFEKNIGFFLYLAVHSTISPSFGQSLAKSGGGMQSLLQRSCKCASCHFVGGDAPCNQHVSSSLDKALAKNRVQHHAVDHSYEEQTASLPAVICNIELHASPIPNNVLAQERRRRRNTDPVVLLLKFWFPPQSKDNQNKFGKSSTSIIISLGDAKHTVFEWLVSMRI